MRPKKGDIVVKYDGMYYLVKSWQTDTVILHDVVEPVPHDKLEAADRSEVHDGFWPGDRVICRGETPGIVVSYDADVHSVGVDVGGCIEWLDEDEVASEAPNIQVGDFVRRRGGSPVYRVEALVEGGLMTLTTGPDYSRRGFEVVPDEEISGFRFRPGDVTSKGLILLLDTSAILRYFVGTPDGSRWYTEEGLEGAPEAPAPEAPAPEAPAPEAPAPEAPRHDLFDALQTLQNARERGHIPSFDTLQDGVVHVVLALEQALQELHTLQRATRSAAKIDADQIARIQAEMDVMSDVSCRQADEVGRLHRALMEAEVRLEHAKGGAR